MESPPWLLPVAGSLCTLVFVVAFVLRMPSLGAAVATVALIVAVGVWNVVSVSWWSLGSAILIILWMMYVGERDHLKSRGIVSGKPLPQSAKWLFVLITVEAVAGIAHSYYTYMP